jgi:DNA-directed RNA polymerase subunit H (RpoH/RPB5)
MSKIDPDVADILIRSRYTILEILEDRGYDTKHYRDIAPEQILTLTEGDPHTLDIIVPKRPDSAAVAERAAVVYELQDKIRQRVAGTWFKDDLLKSPNGILPTDEIIVILNEPYADVFPKFSLNKWQSDRVRITFFHIKNVVVNPAKHILVPPHRKLTDDEAKAEMERLHITQKSQLPLIKHDDMQARVLGLVPGDVVEILRPSPTAGIARVLRICAA